MSGFQPAGIYPALFTPFLEDGGLDLPTFHSHVSYLLDVGMAGVTVAGSTGEAILLTRQERRTLIEQAVAVCRGKAAVIAGTGAASRRETVELTQDAAELGADAVLVMTPFVVSVGQEELYWHYRTLAESVDIPVILYDFPAATNIEITLETIARLSEIPNVAAIKVSSGDLGKMSQLIHSLAGKLTVMCGSDDLLLPSFAIGCPAGILAIGNIAPIEVNGILEAVSRGDLATARKLHYRLLPIARKINSNEFVSVVKESAHRLNRLPSTRVRPPLTELSAAQRQEIDNALRLSELL